MSLFALVIGVLALAGNGECETTEKHVKEIWSRYSQVSNGDTTYYGEYPVNTGACELDPISPVNSEPGWIKVAAGDDDFLDSLGCGMCVEINGDGKLSTPRDSGGKTPVIGPLKATIVDKCGSCKQGGFDLYIFGYDKWQTSFKAIECPAISGDSGNIRFRFDGNPWFIKLQVRNTRVVTVGVELLHSNKWHCMRRTNNNYFTINNLGEIKFPIKLRVTSIANEQLEATVKELINKVDLPTSIQFSGFKADSKPEDIKCYGQGGVTQEAGQPAPSPETPGTNNPGGVPGGTTSRPGPDTTPPGTGEPTTTSAPQGQSTTKAPLGTTPGKPTTTATPQGQPTTKDFCKNKKDDQYPNPKDCSSFIVCSHGNTYIKKCPKGLLYNNDIKVCDWPRSVECEILK